MATEYPKASERAMHYLRRRGATIEEAEDAVQSAAVKALSTKAPFIGNSSFNTWFMRVAINEHLQIKRNRPLARLLAADSLDNVHLAAPDDPEQAVSDAEHIALVMEAVDALPPRQWEAFLQHYLAEMSCQEIATKEGKSLQTIKARVWHAMQAVRSACSSHQLSTTAKT